MIENTYSVPHRQIGTCKHTQRAARTQTHVHAHAQTKPGLRLRPVSESYLGCRIRITF
jgi:hypothetical protein